MDNNNVVQGNVLSVGGFSTVYHCTLNGKEAVCKTINKEKIHIFMNEVKILEKMNHKYITKLLTVIYEKMSFVTEYKGDDLFTFITESNVAKSEKIKILEQLLDSILYIHSNSICHMDLKLENIVYDGNSITIIDFGLSYMYADKNYRILTKRHGTKHYIAPEVYNGEIYNGFVSDMWSLGIIIFALFFNFFPYNTPCLNDTAFSYLINKNVESVCEYYKVNINDVPQLILSILNKILKKKEIRYNISQIKHFFRNSYIKKRHASIIV